MLRALLIGGVFLAAAACGSAAFAAKGYAKMDEMSTDRWALLRETERYQLKIAEDFYLKRDYKVAADEYEKFLTLYESSEGAPYAQMKWSNCQVQLKKLNTAVKDGYQSVIDYWPDSPEAVASAYKIGKTYKDMGDLGPAKQAYQKVLSTYPDEMVAILARFDLADIFRIEQNRPERVAALKELVFKADRTGDAKGQIVDASATLAELMYEDGAFTEGKDALATSYAEPTLSRYLIGGVPGKTSGLPSTVARLVAAADTKDRGLKLADAAIAYLREQQSSVTADDEGKARDKSLSYYIARVDSAAGRPDEAIKQYEAVVKKYPGDDDVFADYGDWLKGAGKYDEARAVYNRMKDPNLAQSHIAGAYRDQRKYDEAATIYQALMSSDPDKSATWQWALAECLRAGGKYKEAIAVYQQTDRFPTNLQMMASCYRAMKQYKEAIGLYSQIVGGYESEAPWALLEIGKTQGQMGENEKAIATLQQVCKRYPKASHAAEAHQILNNTYKITVTLGGAKSE